MQGKYAGGGDAFLVAFNNQLTSLYLSTYYGGAESETGAGVAVDSSGNAYLTGSTDSGGSTLGIPVTTGAFQSSGQGGFDAFLAKFSFSGISLTCSASSPTPLNIPAGGPAEHSDAWLTAKVKSTLLFHRSVSARETTVRVAAGALAKLELLFAKAEKDINDLTLDIRREWMIAGVGAEGGKELYAVRAKWWYTRAATIMGGTAEVQRGIIADHLLGLPKEKR